MIRCERKTLSEGEVHSQQREATGWMGKERGSAASWKLASSIILYRQPDHTEGDRNRGPGSRPTKSSSLSSDSAN